MADRKPDPNTKDPPIEKPKVKVTAKPADTDSPKQKEVNDQAAEKIEKSVADNVRKALDDHKTGGSQQQLDAAKRAVEDAGKQVSPQRVKEIEVQVDGQRGGKPFRKKLDPVEPSEGTHTVEPKK